MSVVRRKVAINESVVCAKLDDEAVLLNVETGIYFGLDAVGSRIWDLLGEGASEEEICRRLLDEYEVDPPQVRADVAAFLDRLVEKGLVRATDA